MLEQQIPYNLLQLKQACLTAKSLEVKLFYIFQTPVHVSSMTHGYISIVKDVLYPPSYLAMSH